MNDLMHWLVSIAFFLMIGFALGIMYQTGKEHRIENECYNNYAIKAEKAPLKLREEVCQFYEYSKDCQLANSMIINFLEAKCEHNQI